MNIRKIVLSSLFAITCAFTYAQSNEVIDEVLVQDKLTYGNGAYLVLTASEIIDESFSLEEAMSAGKEMGWIKDKKQIDAPISLGEYSFLIMKSFDMKGGLFYSIFPSPRYASRELAYQGYISKDSGAYRKLSGQEALSLIGQIVRKRSSK
ncbi:MAG: hypothetical protein PQJ46_06425 [Spirochaetales bacterium]|nr:hypothetical protein [Spirochaetales bacterium]